MRNGIRRPPSVWISQTFLLISALLLLSLPVLSYQSMNGVYRHYGVDTETAARIVNQYVIQQLTIVSPFAAVILWGFWGIARRKPYGRLVGIVALSLVSLAIVTSVVVYPYSPVDYYDSTSQIQSVAVIMSKLILTGLILSVVTRLAFAERVVDFFYPSSAEPIQQPPPPPLFDN